MSNKLHETVITVDKLCKADSVFVGAETSPTRMGDRKKPSGSHPPKDRQDRSDSEPARHREGATRRSDPSLHQSSSGHHQRFSVQHPREYHWCDLKYLGLKIMI